MLTSAMGPLSLLSGGLIQSPCAAAYIQAGLEQPADSAIGAAARIKQDEAAVAARRAAIRYLGTVDCSRWPEAKQALIDGLLKDRSECVRFEAACALQKGCCCNKEIVEALTKCVTGTSDPPENSERVKSAAVAALAHCVVPVEYKRIDVKEPDRILPEEPLKKVDYTTADRARMAQEKAQADVMDSARRALAQVNSGELNAGVVAGPSRPGNVMQIFSNAYNAGSAPGGQPTSAVAPGSNGYHAASVPSSQPMPAVAPGPNGYYSANVPNSQFMPAVAPAPQITPAVAAVPTSTAVTAPSVPERRPFFDGLTQALKGKQPVMPAVAVHDTPAVSTTPFPATPSPASPYIVPAPTVNPPPSVTPWAVMPKGPPQQSMAPATPPYSICVYSMEQPTTTTLPQQIIPAAATTANMGGQAIVMPQYQTANSVRLLPPGGGAQGAIPTIPAPNWPVESTTLPRY
jgi:hypothetical protein